MKDKFSFFVVVIFLLVGSQVFCSEASGIDNYDVNNPHVIINQIYGAGNGGYVTHSFIELYNPTSKDVDLTGWSIQYRSSEDDLINNQSWKKYDFPAGLLIPAKNSLLLRCNADTNTKNPQYKLDLTLEDSYDLQWEQSIHTKGCAVVLCSNDNLIESEAVVFDNSTNKPAIEGFVDLLAVSGNDIGVNKQIINWCEGETQAIQSKKKAVRRNYFADTDNNLNDTVAVDYSTNNIDSFRPRSLKDGVWGDVDKTVYFDKEAGFYDGGISLTLSTKTTSTIYYTLDGRNPVPGTEYTYKYTIGINLADATSKDNKLCNEISVGQNIHYCEDLTHYFEDYVEPVYNVDKCNIVKATAFFDDGTQSDVYTKSYFIDIKQKDSVSDLNILSITTDYENLFDSNNGIYVNENYKNKGKEWEREANCEFFDLDGNLIDSQILGMRIHGSMTRRLAQKSFNLYAREEYDGNKRFKYDFFNNSLKYKSLTLFSGGNDIISKSADYLVYSACINDKYVEITNMIPYALFINGEYWGMYYLEEKYDDKYFQEKYGVKDDNVVMIKNGSIEEGNEEDMELWTETRSYIINNDMENENNYNEACKLIDIDSFIHYYAIQIYIGNIDAILNNYAFWRTRDVGNKQYEDGRWRWILFDVNYHKNMRDYGYDNISWAIDKDPMLKSLMFNAGFRKQFADVLSMIGSQYMSASKMVNLIDDYEEKYTDALEACYDRYYGLDEASDIHNTLSIRKTFFENRYDSIMIIMNDYLYNPGKYLKDTIRYVGQISADCTNKGTREYWQNTRTKKIYDDELCTNEINQDDLVIEAVGHRWGQGIVIKSATQETNGEELYVCTVCGEKSVATIPKLDKKDGDILSPGELNKKDGDTENYDRQDKDNNDTLSPGELNKKDGDTENYDRQDKDNNDTLSPDELNNNDGDTENNDRQDKDNEPIYNNLEIFSYSGICYKKLSGKKVEIKTINIDRKTIQIPDTVYNEAVRYKVTKIDDNALKNNKRVSEVSLGRNIICIGKNTFRNCKKLKTVIIRGQVNKVGRNAFKSINKEAVFKIRASKKNYRKIVKLIKKSGVAKTVKFQRI